MLVYTHFSCHYVVEFIGVYSTQEHPFALVLAFMEHLSLEQYLKSGRCIRRLDLVRIRHHLNPHRCLIISSSAAGSSPRCYEHAHARPRSWKSQDRAYFSHSRAGYALTLGQQNFLVDADGCVRIAGFGAASIPFIAPPVDVDQTFYGAAPELIDPQRFGFVDAKTTKASDVYAFGIIAWEVSKVHAGSSGWNTKLN